MEELGVKALSILVDNLQKGADLMPAYVQDLFQRYIKFEAMWNYYWIGVCVFLLILAICLIRYWYKKDDFWLICIWWVWVFINIVIICWFIYDLFKLMYIPELYMINDLMSYWNCR